MALHRHDFEQAGPVGGDQAVDVTAGGSLEPGIQPAGGFHRPAEAAFGRVVGIAVDQAQGIVDEAVLHFPEDGLVVCVTHIRMGVMDDINGIDGHGVSLH